MDFMDLKTFDLFSALSLFMFRIFANNVHHATPADDFTFFTHDFRTCSHFHIISFDR